MSTIFHQKQDGVSDAALMRHDDPKRLLRFAAESSTVPLKEIACRIDMDEKQLIRCLSHNPNETRHFPFEILNIFQDAIGNEIPLRWLALSRGYGLVRLKSEVERENERLRAEVERLQRDRDVVIQFFREAKP